MLSSFKFTLFCIENNFTPLSNIEFTRKLTKHFNLEIKRKTINRKTYKVFCKNNK